jgi:transketolase
MLLWSALHLTGTRAVNADYETLATPAVTLEDIIRFRQLDSKAPGHPEYHWVSGVETTTGPLGQGVATSVGMAIAQKWLADRFNRPGFEIFDYNIYAVCGDGCLMEGISSEAASLAGHLGLDNLCWIYDNNHITIEGNTRITFTEDVAARFLSYGWNVLRVEMPTISIVSNRRSALSKKQSTGPHSSCWIVILDMVHHTSRTQRPLTASR